MSSPADLITIYNEILPVVKKHKQPPGGITYFRFWDDGKWFCEVMGSAQYHEALVKDIMPVMAKYKLPIQEVQYFSVYSDGSGKITNFHGTFGFLSASELAELLK